MDTGQLDDLLDSSAPVARSLDPGDVRAMMVEARVVEGPKLPRRRVRTALTAGAALALIVGGGGVAVAAGLVTWPSALEHPDGSYGFALPSGRACEVRLLVEDRTASTTDAGQDDVSTRDVQDSVATWLRDGALERELDLEAADDEAARILAEQADRYGMTVLIGADGWLADAAIAPGRPDADDARAFAVNRAVHEAMIDHLVGAGFPEDTWTFSADGGVKCEAE
jgi:hypothetical protein